MSDFEIHIMVLCIVVFALLVGVLTTLLVVVYRQTISLIRLGAYDAKIKAENNRSKKGKAGAVFSIVLEVLIWVVLLGIIVFNIYMSAVKDDVVGDIPILKTVNSSSMATKYKLNHYLMDNELDDQVGTRDLILLEKLPAIEDIEQYDIVSYEYEGRMILHRIIYIYEPGDLDNEERLFELQGDAVPASDIDLVEYSQMKGIYRGKRLKNVGSFIRFMHSPAGYICLVFVFIALVALPIFEKKIESEKAKRLADMSREE